MAAAAADAAALSPRAQLKTAHPAWCADARASTLVTLAPAACFAGGGARGAGTLLPGGAPLPPGAAFAPPFIHQLFPEELLFGFREPALRVWLRDPDLAACATAGARAALASPGVHTGSAPLLSVKGAPGQGARK